MVNLAALLPQCHELPDIELAQMHLDSRAVASGDLFVAIPGHVCDGREYIDSAIGRGAAAVLSHSDLPEPQVRFQAGVPVVSMPQLKSHLPKLAAAFYQQPGASLEIIGVTGTNGKSSVTHLIAQLSEVLGQRCGIFGTLGNGCLDALEPSVNTTPDAVALQRQLAQLRDTGVQRVAMEVSSHGLEQGRVDQVPIATAVFTNLTRDHLDYHGSMAQYRAAKYKLFSLSSVRTAVVNVDTDEGRVLCQQLPAVLNLIAVGQTDTASAYSRHLGYRELALFSDGMRCVLSGSWGEAALYLPLLGEFNLSNLLLAFACLLEQGLSLPELVTAAAALKPVTGRMQLLHRHGQPTLVIDYAHTPDALKKALRAARVHCHGQLWCVFGCGGDRDRGKRPLMGQVALEGADRVILTADNPRSEPLAQINQDLLEGVSSTAEIEQIDDRQAAIESAFNRAQADDLILIAGKGHESYQIIGNQRYDFSDIAVAQALLEDAL